MDGADSMNGKGDRQADHDHRLRFRKNCPGAKGFRNPGFEQGFIPAGSGRKPDQRDIEIAAFPLYQLPHPIAHV